MTVLASTLAVFITCPDKVVRNGVESQDLSTKRVRGCWSSKRVPRSPSISRIVKQVGIGDEVGTIRCVLVMVKGKEGVFREQLLPSIAFIAGLPNGLICESHENCLGKQTSLVRCKGKVIVSYRRLLEVGVLKDETLEIELNMRDEKLLARVIIHNSQFDE